MTIEMKVKSPRECPFREDTWNHVLCNHSLAEFAILCVCYNEEEHEYTEFCLGCPLRDYGPVLVKAS